MTNPPSVALARTLVEEFIAAGVTDAVLAPGSRNAPLSIALQQADAVGRIRLHVRIDERTAGFLALGLGRGAGRPALVATTSGTAVANLHPAVLEAHHGGVPMIVLSADRPPALRELGANQVIDQRRVFGPALRLFTEIDTPAGDPGDPARWRSAVGEAMVAATAALPGPVQLNLPLAEPLLPDDDEPWSPAASSSLVPQRQPFEQRQPMDATPIEAPRPGERVLFLADLTHPAAAGVAAAGHPVIAESGGAAGSAVLDAGIPLLEAGFADLAPPDRVVVLGRPTLYRAVSRLLATAPRIDVVGPTGPVADPTGRAHAVAAGLAPIAAPAAPAFRTAWREANAAAATVIARRLAGADLALGPKLARELVATLPSGEPGIPLVLGSSQTPRDVGRFATARAGIRVIANRGVAGIDGSNSTAVGVALASGRPTVALMGDLTFLYDLTGLLIGPHEPRPDLTIVVSNNDGGAIFATLEPGQPRYGSAFERVFGTPHGAAVGQAVEAFGVEHVLVTEPEQLRAELADGTGIRVLEVPTSRTDLRDWLADTGAAVQAAL
ncbi:2-succinyl-5-enolpyruvyl-6-hydroxy-3-cyclohexene-1-carboxylic-acid synthase [Nakamurella lactea]|uniref:2-succinyl-5-enolpyruvyl-6-hydroxy-3- cyclohexene-1-carboxylic-acid synthase n=1 Tax=Nakamurella lactea TaxID=459515 RepID=UPI000428C210|nr:2-succinyl-5-enolpyruvyl-6-hydroxy-3-cyclohexene-1-carboxylic-acid synthase [Nakamurella lactea]